MGRAEITSEDINDIDPLYLKYAFLFWEVYANLISKTFKTAKIKFRIF